jgi:N-acyl-D-amino-acid deacylase
VREKETIDLAMAIRSMTHLPASVFRVQDRGLLREGAFADIVVFDLDQVNDPADFDEPHRLAEGMVYVMVNGQLALERGEFSAEKHGRILRR